MIRLVFVMVRPFDAGSTALKISVMVRESVTSVNNFFLAWSAGVLPVAC